MDTENAGLTDAAIDLISKNIKLVHTVMPNFIYEWDSGPVHNLFLSRNIHRNLILFMGDSTKPAHQLYPSNLMVGCRVGAVVQREDGKYFIQETIFTAHKRITGYPFLSVPSFHSQMHGLDYLDYVRYFPLVIAPKGFPIYYSGDVSLTGLIDPEWPFAAKVESVLFSDNGCSWRIDHILVKARQLLYRTPLSDPPVTYKSRFQLLERGCALSKMKYATRGE